MIKQPVKQLILILSLFPLLFGCNKIDDQTPEDENSGLFSLSTPQMQVKNVLLEHFTGHKCGNCPSASSIADEIKNTHGGRINILNIHAGVFAETDSDFPTDWTTDTGDDIWNQVSMPFNPSGRVNRINDGNLSLATFWENEVEDELDKETTVVLQVIADLNSNGILEVHVFSEFIKSYPGELKMAAYIVESELHGAQLDYGSEPNYVENYEFNNVLRDDINGFEGIVLSSYFNIGLTLQHDYNYTINPSWNIGNCSIIAFVYDPSTGYILNSIEKDID